MPIRSDISNIRSDTSWPTKNKIAKLCLSKFIGEPQVRVIAVALVSKLFKDDVTAIKTCGALEA